MRTLILSVLSLASVSAAALGLAVAAVQAPKGPPSDVDGDGQVTREEAMSHAVERFERMDADANGAVTEEEMKAARDEMRKARQGAREGKKGKRGGRGFLRADTDEDGQVSRAEIMASAEARFDRADANGDGYLTKDEMPRRGERGGKGHDRKDKGTEKPSDE